MSRIFTFLMLYLSISVSAFRKANIGIGRKFSRLSMVDIFSLQSVQDVYHQVLENNGLLTDMTTVFISNTVSDCIAQYTEKQKVIDVSVLSADASPLETISDESNSGFNVGRVIRFAIFGFFDGAVGHNWFIALDQVIQGTDGISIVYKVIADTLVFTPVWVAWFLFAMGLLEGNLQKKVTTNKLQSEYKELLYIDVGFFLPLSTVVYSIVPREARVLVFSIANLLYTSIVSLWNQKKVIELSALK